MKIDYLFNKDNFTSRRTTGHNLYDPECLITGKEIASGLTYQDKRDWQDREGYIEACSQVITPNDIAVVAPRTKEYVN